MVFQSDDEADDVLPSGTRSNTPDSRSSVPATGTASAQPAPSPLASSTNAIASGSNAEAMDVDRPAGVEGESEGIGAEADDGDVTMKEDFTEEWPAPPLPANLIDPDDDDEILHTMPIFVSHNLASQLHLFQYPLNLRTPSLNEWARNNNQSITARMKENVKRFELEVPVDMRQEVWNDERAEEMHFMPDVSDDRKKKGKGKEKEEPRNWGTKMRLRSEEVPEVTGYWSGMVHDGALHLQPIPQLYQLRPTLGYLDVVEAAMRAEKEKARKKASGEQEEEEGPTGGKEGAAKEDTELKAVLSQAQNAKENTLDRRRTKMGTAGTVGSTDEIRGNIVKRAQDEAADPWVPWQWASEAGEIEEVLNRLVVSPQRQATLVCTTNPLDILSKKNIGTGAILPN